jgi:hypothetical protein
MLKRYQLDGLTRKENELMMYVTTLDVKGLTASEYRAILDKMGVETSPAPNIFLHMTTPIDGGYRIVEIWDDKQAFEAFLKNRLSPANEALGLTRQAAITITPLHNFFAPRLRELPDMIRTLPGAPRSDPTEKGMQSNAVR